MNKPFYIHVPFKMLPEKLPLIAQHKVNVEILFNANYLDDPLPETEAKVRKFLAAEGLGCTFHGPFMDLSPGAFDLRIREVTCQRFMRVMDIAKDFGPRVIVLHPGYDDLRFGEAKDRWLENSFRTWEVVLSEAEKYKLHIALENIFDKTPEMLLRLLQHFSSPYFGHCLDVGHFNIFANYDLLKWLDELGPYLKEVHLHDNHGQQDEHLAPGEGEIDFPFLFSQLSKRKLSPALTIEAHNQEHALLAIERVNRLLGNL